MPPPAARSLKNWLIVGKGVSFGSGAAAGRFVPDWALRRLGVCEFRRRPEDEPDLEDEARERWDEGEPVRWKNEVSAALASMERTRARAKYSFWRWSAGLTLRRRPRLWRKRVPSVQFMVVRVMASVLVNAGLAFQLQYLDGGRWSMERERGISISFFARYGQVVPSMR